MDTHQITLFFQWLTIIVGIFYLMTSLWILLGQKFLISMQKKVFKIDEKTMKALLWGYIAVFKVVFLVFVLGPYLALLMLCEKA